MRAELQYGVYRLYDEWCTPLYYGSSGNVFNRLGNHSIRDWYADVGMVLIDWYPTIEIARAVERGVICRDLPRHNVLNSDSVPLPAGMPSLPESPIRVIWAPSPAPRITPGPRLQITPAPEVDIPALLHSIYEAFGRAPRISTGDLVAALIGMGWKELAETKTPARRLAAWLVPLGIRSRAMRIVGLDRPVRGYARYNFAPHWSALDTTPPPV